MTGPPPGSADAVAARPGLSGGRWSQKYSAILDLVVVLAIFAYNLALTPLVAPGDAQAVPDEMWQGIGIVFGVAMCAPYVLRRRHPLGTFGVILSAAGVQVLLGIHLIPADFMLFFALYNLASRHRWVITAPAAAAVVAVLLVTTVPVLRMGFMTLGSVGLLVVAAGWAWTWGTLVRVRADHIASLRERARQLERERDAQAEIVAARERARIAREIHDIVSHSLSVAVVMADGAASKAHSEPDRARTAMESVRDTSRTALAEMRRMLGVLRTDEPGSQAPQPGTAELSRLVEESKEAGLPVRLRVDGTPVEVSTGLDLVVYRVVQEALTNVRKHAAPPLSRVEVTLAYRDAELEIRVTDDGGISTQEHGTGRDEGTGHGLIGMRERVAAYGGTLRTGTRPSGGYEVVARLPTGGDA